MSEKRRTLDSLESFLEEHQHLSRRIAELRKWWSELDELGTPKFEEMAHRVDELRRLLADHFVEEERDGYLASALAVAPQFAAQADDLCRQHRQFLDRLDTLIAGARVPQPPPALWRTARGEIEGILSELRRHEQTENAIVQAAFEDDVGTKD